MNDPTANDNHNAELRSRPESQWKGIYLAGGVMLKGVFNGVTAILGIVGATFGIVGGFYEPLSVLLSPCLVVAGVWAVLSGVRLRRLAGCP